MNTQIPAGKWTIDASHSEINFSVKHLMISRVKGNFGVFNGSAITSDNLANSALEVEIDMNSISTNDNGRDDHLRSEDFFDVASFPTATFVSHKVEQISPTKLKVHGDLSMHGITLPQVFDVSIGGVMQDPYGNTKGAAEATVKINRSDYGLTWNTVLEAGGMLVGEEITITAEIQAALDA